jgi:hypothetical protein
VNYTTYGSTLNGFSLSTADPYPAYTNKIFYISYLGENDGGLVDHETRVLLVADLFVHIIKDLKVLCLFLLV